LNIHDVGNSKGKTGKRRISSNKKARGKNSKNYNRDRLGIKARELLAIQLRNMKNARESEKRGGKRRLEAEPKREDSGSVGHG